MNWEISVVFDWFFGFLYFEIDEIDDNLDILDALLLLGTVK